jgi:hypothetical protein
MHSRCKLLDLPFDFVQIESAVTYRMSLVDHLLDIVLPEVSVSRIIQRFDVASRLEL